jgi:hypothetical protein
VVLKFPRRYAFFGLALLAPGCTALVDFVDAPVDPCEAGLCKDQTLDVGNGDAAPDVRDAAAIDASGACKGKGNGFYCGNNGLTVLLPKEYLVECRDASAKVTLCDGGCLAFPSGYPDRCDPCPGKANGNYCGSQLGLGAENAQYLLSCGNGSAVIQKLCATGCAGDAGTAKCNP